MKDLKEIHDAGYILSVKKKCLLEFDLYDKLLT